MTATILALDLGTGGLRGLVVDASGAVHAIAAAGYSTRRPRPGWAEQDPADWWQALQVVTARLRDADPEAWRRLQGVGFTGQSPGVVLAAADGTPLAPAIIWQDRRATAEAAELAAAVPAEQWLAWTGFAHGYQPGTRPAKVRWMVVHRPEAVAAARWLLQPKDWLIYRLTGRAVIDTGAMRGSGLSHEPGGLWDVLGLPVDRLPEPVERAARAGTVRPGLIAGLEGLPVFPGTYDGTCGVLGSGPTGPGDAVSVLGTSQIVALVVAGRRDGPGLSANDLGAGLWTLGGFSATGGGTVEAAMALFGFTGWDVLETAAAAAPPGAGGVLFVPYLTGERTPHWDPDLRGALVGLGADHDRTHLARAILEGHALVVADIVDRAVAASGQAVAVLRCSGGMARSRVSLQARADLLGVPVAVPEVTDASALGAAVFAAVGLGWFPDPAAAAARLVREARRLEPQEERPDDLARFRATVGGGLLRQDRIGRELSASLTEQEVGWLDSDLG